MRATQRPFSHVNQCAQGGIDGFLVAKVLGYVWRQEHEVGPCPIPRKIG